MKKVQVIPPMEHAAKRDPWFNELFDGNMWELSEADWSPRYGTVRSASSAVKQAAEHRSITAQVAIRGDKLFVQAILNGQVKAKPAKKAAAKKVTPIKAAAKKAAARPPRARKTA